MDIEKFNYINSLIGAESNISFTLKDELHLVYNTQIAGQLMFVNKKIEARCRASRYESVSLCESCETASAHKLDKEPSQIHLVPSVAERRTPRFVMVIIVKSLTHGYPRDEMIVVCHGL